MSCYLLQEDGVSRFILEDGTGFLLLESCTPPVVPPEPGVGGPLRKGRRRRLEVIDEELDWLAVVLNEV